ncbi:hypothetical protein DGo_PA0370 (plasmid) [Deinococcus gobiensis I-0]|uniref:Uncharacterized protein n=1 Tax=Deinococcus gobiensis (strain DSM 21396 / JCM 16679 / CGMCC 1.7299 / I-0) TaxID=745776 RepID=H8H0K4_DEIGI|nr:hypothetical protein DGo_PA0370 [Deinococcus gobiensis I-0]
MNGGPAGARRPPGRAGGPPPPSQGRPHAYGPPCPLTAMPIDPCAPREARC